MFHHPHQSHYRLLPHLGQARGSTSLQRFYASSFLHDMGWAMLATFTLFYLYQLGWSLPAILIFILIGLIAQVCLMGHLANWLLTKYKIVTIMTASNLMRVGYTLCVFSLSEPSPSGVLLFGLTAFLGASSYQLYYAAWDIFFVNEQSPSRAGKQMATFWVLGAVVGFLAPLIAGFTAQAWGFKVNLLISGLLLLFSIAPLLTLKQTVQPAALKLERVNLHLKRYWQIFKATPKRPLLAAVASGNVAMVMMPIWLLYLAVTIFTKETYSGLGLIAAVSALVAIGVSKLAGYFVDKGRPELLLKGSASLELLLGLGRLFVVNAPLAFTHNILQQQSLTHDLINSNWYYRSARHQPHQRLAFFQVYTIVSRGFRIVCFLIILGLLLLFSDHQFTVLGYSCAALGLLGLPIFLGASGQARQAAPKA